MKRLLLIAMLTAAASACVEGTRPAQILSANVIDPATCDAGEAQLNGTLNYDLTTQYLAGFTLASPLQGEETLRNDFYGKELVLNYESKNPSINFNEEVLPIYLVVLGGSDNNFVTLPLLGTAAQSKLDGAVPTLPDIMTLLVSLKIKGNLSSGNAAETNEVTFPLQVARGGACGAGQVPVPVEPGPCSNPGQDGQPFTCQ